MSLFTCAPGALSVVTRMPTKTVEDVFVACLPSSVTQDVPVAHVVQATKVWLTRHNVLSSSTTAEDFFARPDTFGWADSPDFLLHWATAVARKFLKFAASEYAYFHIPAEEATMWLTVKTASLIKQEHLKVEFQQQLQDTLHGSVALPLPCSSEMDTVSILHAVLFVLIFYQRPAVAARAIEPVFLAILRKQEENFIVVPQLLSYFLPHMSFRDVPLPDRVAMLGNELTQRGFQFSAGFTFVSPNAPPLVDKVAPMKADDVLRRVREVPPTTDVRIRSRIEHDNGDISEADDLTLNKYISVVVDVCHQYYVRCKQATKAQRKNGDALLRLTPNDVDRVMKELHKMLRFCEPYATRFQELRLWRDILTSEGWVPLQVVEEQLSLLPNSILKHLPSNEKRRIVESLLLQHDNYQRYQIDYCLLRDSAFRHQRCVRSIYGHALTNPPLYRHIIRHIDHLVKPGDENAVARLPLYGWVALSGRPQKTFDAHLSILPLFDNIPFCVVMPAEAIGSFRNYVEMTPTSKMYDEKLRKPVVHFAEVYLRALVRDGEAMVDDSGTVGFANPSPAESLSVSSTTTQQRQKGADECEACSVASSVYSMDLATEATASVTASVKTTEVYNQIRSEADTRTQRWYVFPQYYARKIQRSTRIPPPAPQKPFPSETEEATTDSQNDMIEANLELTAVRRSAPRSSFHMGVPKLFFTGRLAELRKVRDYEERRHTTVYGDEDECNGNGRAQATTKATGSKSTSSSVNTEAGESEGDVNDEGTSKEEDNQREGRMRKTKVKCANGDAEAQLVCYRGTPREFDTLDVEGGDSEDDAVQLPPPVRLHKYAIVTTRASTSLLPAVVVRAKLETEGDTGHDTDTYQSKQTEATSSTTICLSTHEPAASLYRRCFPPSRMQAIFRDYLNDQFMKEETVKAEAAAEAAAAAEWERASRANSQTRRRLGQWGITTPFLLPKRATTDAAAAARQQRTNGNNSNTTNFNTAPLLEVLAKFIASDQVACVLEIRVATEAGEPISGCRNGIDELKVFANERALSYATIGKVSSRDRERLLQQGRSASDANLLKNNAALKADNSADGNPTSLDPRTVLPASPKSGEGTNKILDIELIEFRKRVNWSVRDLDHILSELQLSVREVSYATLTAALTMESEDRSANYEQLEFIGDAVMDFLAVSDTCLLANTVYQRRLAERDECSPSALPPALTTRPWKPEASRVELPRHCWVDTAQPLSGLMTDNVTSLLCRNHVIAELLPPTAVRHFSEANYPTLALKVRADVFEALIGAVYRSGAGLDRVRGLLRRLFSFLPAAVRTAAAAKAACTAELMAALQACPYLFEEDALCVEKMFRYCTKELLELTPKLLEANDAAGQAMVKEARVNTHLVSSRLPRIQAKEYSTMFTTGSGYAYRRLLAFETVRMHNRILHLFSEQSIGFVNEIFTNTIHLVLDIDKVGLQSWGLLRILWEWYKDRYRCPAGLLALDCSGRTMSNKELKWKDSCHIHFPQVTVSVDTWNALVTDIRAAVVSELSTKEARLRDTFVAHAHEYRMWFRRSTLLRTLKACGGEAQPHMWGYCDSDSLLQLACTCRGVRLSVLEHVAYLTRTLEGTTAFAGLVSEVDVFVGDAKVEEEVVVVEHLPTRHRLILPLDWIERCRADPPQAVFKPVETWNDIIDQGLAKSKKLRLYLNDKCDMIYGVEKRPLVLDTLLLTPPVMTVEKAKRQGVLPAVQEGNYILYRPQRFDRPPQETTDSFSVHRARQDAARREEEHAMQLLIKKRQSSEVHQDAENTDRTTTWNAGPPAAEDQPIKPIKWNVSEFGDDLAEGWVIECAHRSTLALSSLRTSEYRGTDAKTYSSWVDCPPYAAQADEHTTVAHPNASMLLHQQEGYCDVLPSFDDVYEHRVVLPGQLKSFEWVAWFNFFKMRGRDYVMRDDKVSTIRVWSPAWWAFDSAQHTVTFYIATEAVLRLSKMDSLAQALAPPVVPGGGAGLERIAQLFMPQISTRDKTPIKVKEKLVYLLFLENSSSTGNPTVPNVSPVTLKPHASLKTVATTPQPQTKVTPTVVGAAAKQTSAMALLSPTVTVASPAAAGSRGAFNRVPIVVSLAKWVDAQETRASAAAWLRCAVSFVFSVTAARTEFGCVPLMLCDSEAVYADVCRTVRQSLSGSPSQQNWLPFILPLHDMGYVERVVKEALEQPRELLRHIFVVTPSIKDDKATTLALSRTLLLGRIQVFQKLLNTTAKDGSAVRRYYYVSTDTLRQDLEAALHSFVNVI